MPPENRGLFIKVFRNGPECGIIFVSAFLVKVNFGNRMGNGGC